MTEQTNFADQGNTPVSGVNSVSTETVSQPAGEARQEKLLRQSEVTEIAKGAKLDGYKKGREEALAEYQAQQGQYQQMQQPNSTQQRHVQQVGGVTQLTPDEIQRQIDERVRQGLMSFQQQQQNLQIANSFVQKLEAGKTKYPDFKDVVTDSFLENFVKNAPVVFHMTNGFDNTDDLVYELRKNPGNIIKLRDLAQLDPSLANEELKRLSDSIKQNRAASNKRTANEPLDQVKPSSAGLDSGSRTKRDYRNDPRYRA